MMERGVRRCRPLARSGQKLQRPTAPFCGTRLLFSWEKWRRARDKLLLPMSYEHNIGPPTAEDIRRTRRKGVLRRALELYFRRLGALVTLPTWSRASSHAPTKEAREYATHMALEQLGMEEDGAESPAGLPEADLTSEEEERAQEGFRREYGERR